LALPFEDDLDGFDSIKRQPPDQISLSPDIQAKLAKVQFTRCLLALINPLKERLALANRDGLAGRRPREGI
jgi:hypothetical protein